MTPKKTPRPYQAEVVESIREKLRQYPSTVAVVPTGGGKTSIAAWVINELVQPKSVIASHANEAATENGQVEAGSKTAAFMEATNVPVHLPLSDRTMEFDAGAACVNGC